MTIVAVIWDAFLASIYYISPFKNIVFWIAILLAGWFLLSIFAVLYQPKRYPNYLYSEKGIEISIFFKFSFTTRVSADEINTLNKIMKPYHQSIHGLIFLVTMVAYLIVLMMLKPFNYNRLNFWAFMTIVAVIWDAFLASIYYISPYENDLVFWKVMLLAGWALLGLFVYLYQKKKYPNYLYSEKDIEIAIYFKFAFTNRVTPDEINNLHRENCQEKNMNTKKTVKQICCKKEQHNINFYSCFGNFPLNNNCFQGRY